VTSDGGNIEVVTDPDDFGIVLTALEKAGFENSSAEISKVADAYVTLDNDKTSKALRLIETLDDHDDVQSVATNLDIPEDFVPEE
jgi:transcriptional/translational regulatory protein YebC/TACO1